MTNEYDEDEEGEESDHSRNGRTQERRESPKPYHPTRPTPKPPSTTLSCAPWRLSMRSTHTKTVLGFWKRKREGVQEIKKDAEHHTLDRSGGNQAKQSKKRKEARKKQEQKSLHHQATTTPQIRLPNAKPPHQNTPPPTHHRTFQEKGREAKTRENQPNAQQTPSEAHNSYPTRADPK